MLWIKYTCFDRCFEAILCFYAFAYQISASKCNQHTLMIDCNYIRTFTFSPLFPSHHNESLPTFELRILVIGFVSR